MPGIELDETAALEEMDDLGRSERLKWVLADINVLIYAFRQDSARHTVCTPWLDKVVSGDAWFGVSSSS